MKIIETGGLKILIDSKQFESLKNLRAGQIKNPHFCGKTELQNTITKVNSSLYPNKELYLAEAWGDIRVKAFQCVSSVDERPQSGHHTYFKNADEAVLYHYVLRTVLEHGISIVDSIQNTTTKKETTMQKERMTLVENVEVLSNAAYKTIGYTITFDGKQNTITAEQLAKLANSEFIQKVLGDFQPIQGAKVTFRNYGLPVLSLVPEPFTDFSAELPQHNVENKYDPSKADLIEWVQAFNKFLDEIDALNIENVDVPTFKNIVLV